MMDEAAMAREAAKAKRWNLIIFTIFAVLIALLAAAFGVYRYQHTYSRQKWDAAPESRHKIVSDMLEKHPLAGLDEAEVVELLGQEDGGPTSFKITRGPYPPETTLVYYLGVVAVDESWLVISLEDGVVTDYCIDVT
jgi:hypothetical protein